MNQPFYCQVMYPVQIRFLIDILEYEQITEEEFNQLSDYKKQCLIKDYADVIFNISSIEPLIVDCDDEFLND